MSKSDPAVPGRWSHRKRDLAIIAWISFLAACIGTFVSFAMLDPDGLSEAWVLNWQPGRKLTYSLGFLFCLLIAAVASSLTVFMIRTGPRRGHFHGKGKSAPPKTDKHAAEDPQLGLDPAEWREG
jgi:hypothetical protein